MATVKVKHPKIIVIEYLQDIEDEDYGSCLWARFYFDTKNYQLSIDSDCGSYGCSWPPTPDTESFLKLCSRFNPDYLLEKISDTSIVDGDKTWENVKEYIEAVLDGEEPDFDLDAVENVCYYSESSEVYEAILSQLKYTNANNDFFDEYEILQCIETTYPYNAKKIVEVYKEHIIPKIKEILKDEGTCKIYKCSQEII